MMKHKITVATTLLFTTTSPVLKADKKDVNKTASDSPNIIVIMTDDQTVHSMDYMPNLQELLIDQGTTFTNFIINVPHCCPSRATLLRGQYAHNHQVITNRTPDGGFSRFRELDREQSTVATWLQDAGYRTAFLGKYLNGYPGGANKYVPPGWDEWYAFVQGHYYNYKLNENRDIVEYGTDPDDYATDVFADKAADFIGRTSGESPFFIMLATNAPHTPFQVASRHNNQFTNLQAPRPPSFNEADVSDKPEWIRDNRVMNQDEIDSIDDNYRKRLRMLLAVDDMLETIVDALAANNELDNTYIFFTSDNGFHKGEHRRERGKGSPYEEAIRVPLVVRGPGVPQSQELEHVTSNIDLAPTFAALGGANTPSWIDGISFKPLLGSGPPSINSWRPGILVQHWRYEGTGYSIPDYKGVRTKDHLYVEYGTDEIELYDLHNDPYQLENLDQTAEPELLSALSAHLHYLSNCAGADCSAYPDEPGKPVIASFNPTSGQIGTEVTIAGGNFLGTHTVTFNGVSATTEFIDSDNQIRAEVPTGASTGKIRVTNAFGTGSSTTDFTVTSGGGVITDYFDVIHDAYVRSSRPTDNYGDSDDLKVRKTSAVDRHSYLKFKVSGLSGPIQSARLRVYVTDASTDGGSVYLVSNNYQGSSVTWTEDGLIWNNAPEISGQSLSTAGAVKLNEVVEFDVTSAVSGNGVYSFAIKNKSSDIAIYSSKERVHGAQLVVESTSGTGAVPIITSFTPTSGLVGSEVTILGSNFIGANTPTSGAVGAEVTLGGNNFIGTTNVSINGTAVSVFAVVSNTEIRFNVPVGASSGKISVTNGDGTGTSSNVFTVILPPEITSFTPASGPVGTEVTISGSHFTGVTEVYFNGALASNVSVVSDNQVRATVPSDVTSGTLVVNNPAGSDTSAAQFTVIAAPGNLMLPPTDDALVHSRYPTRNYGSSSHIRIRKTSSSVQKSYLKFNILGLNEPPEIAMLKLFVIDEGSEGGSVYLVSNNYQGSDSPWQEEGLLVDNAPVISGTPLVTIGAVSLHDTVAIDVSSVITGDGIYSFAITNNSSDAVWFSSKEGDVAPELVIEAVVNSEPVPVVSSFTPTVGVVGTMVTILGSNFMTVTGVSFNGTLATVYSLDSETKLRAFVPTGASTGKISVTNPHGTVVSGGTFTVILPPVITSFVPLNGPVGTEVTINGSNFTDVSNVAFSALNAPTFILDSSTKIRAKVPTGATTGKIKVTNAAGDGISVEDFTVTEALPALSFFPSHDSFVRSNKPQRNYGSSSELRVRKPYSGYIITYLKFNVAGIAGEVQNARIRLFVVFGSEEGGSIYFVSNNFKGEAAPWEEGGLLWPNSPSIDGEPLSTLGRISAGDTVEWDVTTAMNGDGTYSFAILNTVNAAAKYSSKEGDIAPELVVEMGPASRVSSKMVDTLPPNQAMEITDEVIPLPKTITLSPNYPNPFNMETNIEYSLPDANQVLVAIYNILGQEVRRLVDDYQPAGLKKVSWNGRDNVGKELGSGIYILRVEVGKQRFFKKIVLQK